MHKNANTLKITTCFYSFNSDCFFFKPVMLINQQTVFCHTKLLGGGGKTFGKLCVPVKNPGCAPVNPPS